MSDPSFRAAQAGAGQTSAFTCDRSGGAMNGLSLAFAFLMGPNGGMPVYPKRRVSVGDAWSAHLPASLILDRAIKVSPGPLKYRLVALRSKSATIQMETTGKIADIERRYHIECTYQVDEATGMPTNIRFHRETDFGSWLQIEAELSRKGA